MTEITALFAHQLVMYYAKCHKWLQVVRTMLLLRCCLVLARSIPTSRWSALLSVFVILRRVWKVLFGLRRWLLQERRVNLVRDIEVRQLLIYETGVVWAIIDDWVGIYGVALHHFRSLDKWISSTRIRMIAWRSLFDLLALWLEWGTLIVDNERTSMCSRRTPEMSHLGLKTLRLHLTWHWLSYLIWWLCHLWNSMRLHLKHHLIRPLIFVGLEVVNLLLHLGIAKSLQN